MRFRDRTDAGRQLAGALAGVELTSAPVVLALPRGGVPVALEVSLAFDWPMDVFVARKVGAPGHAELGIGAIAEGGGVVVDRQALQALAVSRDVFDRLVEEEWRELDRRVQRYRGDRQLPDLDRRDVVVVDDGLATGLTAEAAVRALHGRNPRRLVLAVPVCAPATAERLRHLADDVVCVEQPTSFHAVGQFYKRFTQTSDTQVLDLLAATR